MSAADILVHCGDFIDMGMEEKVLDFLSWFISLPYPHNKTHYRLNLERFSVPLNLSKAEHDSNNKFPITSVTQNEDITD